MTKVIGAGGPSQVAAGGQQQINALSPRCNIGVSSLAMNVTQANNDKLKKTFWPFLGSMFSTFRKVSAVQRRRLTHTSAPAARKVRIEAIRRWVVVLRVVQRRRTRKNVRLKLSFQLLKNCYL